MLDKDTINNMHEQVIDLLDEGGKLKDVFALLTSMCEMGGDYQLQEELDSMKTSYNYMMQYMEQGMEDPERNTIYDEMHYKAYNLAERIKISQLDEVSEYYYHTLRKRLKKHPLPHDMVSILDILESFDDSISLYELTKDEEKLMADMKAHEAALKEMFMLTWTNSKWSKSDKNTAYRYLSSTLITSNDLSLLVSAVTLSLTMCFDIDKMYWLLDTCSHKDTQVRVRAQVGIIVTLLTQYHLTNIYKPLESRLTLMAEEDPNFANTLNDTLTQMIRSQATESISKTMQEEIVPEVMKNIQDKMQHPSPEDNEDMDQNPDWMFDLGDKMSNKMNKIAEFQQEGGDINMVTFSLLKNFTFFNELHNWFMPFDTMHSEVIKTMGVEQEGDNRLYMRFLQAGMFSSSDCYSLVCMMQQMPPDKRKLAFSGLSQEHMEMIFEEANNEEITKKALSPASIRKFYIQDLYRFYKLSAFRKEFKDIFKDDMAIHNAPLMEPVIHFPQYVRKVADLYFKVGMYERALYAYRDLMHLEDDSCDILQRMGYCCEVLKGSYSFEAIRYYERALIIQPQNEWTLKHLARCYRKNFSYNKEEECYRELLRMEPENPSIIYKMARSLIDANYITDDKSKYEEALQLLFKLDLAEDNNVKAWRGITWCYFALDKLEMAQKYSDRLIALTPDANDWLNAGHIAWCQGNVPQAIQCYRNASKLSEDIRKAFFRDKHLLTGKGFNETDLSLMAELF